MVTYGVVEGVDRLQRGWSGQRGGDRGCYARGWGRDRLCSQQDSRNTSWRNLAGGQASETQKEKTFLKKVSVQAKLRKIPMSTLAPG